MKKTLSLILALLIISSPVFASINYEYEPYEKDEFPIWSNELRRAESLFFGSLVLTYPVSYGALYAAQSLGASLPDNDGMRVLTTAGVAAGISLVIVLIDYIMGKVKS